MIKPYFTGIFLAFALLAFPASAQHPQMGALMTQASQGDAEANFQIGRIYNFGLHVPQDYDKARTYFEKAAEKDHPEANAYLASIHLNGDGSTPENANKFRQYQNEAIRLMTASTSSTQNSFKTLALAGSPQNEWIHGAIEWDDNWGEGLKWVRKAAQSGHPVAQDFLGRNLIEDPNNLFGDKKTPKDPYEAIHWLEKAAEQGYLDSQRTAGRVRYTGIYAVPRNYIKAEKWISQAAQRGDPEAQNLYGFFLNLGHAGEDRVPESKDWWEKAAMQGNSSAQVSMGNLFVYGTLVEKDSIQAYAWLNVAADKSPSDKSQMDEIEKEMTDSQIAKAQNLSEELFQKIHRRSE